MLTPTCDWVFARSHQLSHSPRHSCEAGTYGYACLGVSKRPKQARPQSQVGQDNTLSQFELIYDQNYVIIH